MTMKKVAMINEVSTNGSRVTPEENVEARRAHREPEDLFSSLKRRQNADASDIAAALACLSVGSGSEEV